VRERIQPFELVILDEGIPVVAGWAVPITWGETRDDLPAGCGEALGRGLDEETRDGEVSHPAAVLSAEISSRSALSSLAWPCTQLGQCGRSFPQNRRRITRSPSDVRSCGLASRHRHASASAGDHKERM